MAIKVVENIDNQGQILDSSIISALKYISSFTNKEGKNLIRLINASFGKFEKSTAITLMLAKLKRLRDGILMVAAAGNENSSQKTYPAALQQVISVAAVDDSNIKTNYSNYGYWVDIAAPGGNHNVDGNFFITSTAPGYELSETQGTSAAAPMVTGAAGLILAKYPNISIETLKSRIINYTSPFPEQEHGYKKTNLLGTGILNIDNAINIEKGIKMTQNLPTRKIKQNCACLLINSQEEQKNSHRFLKLLILLPIIISAFLRKRYDTNSIKCP